MNLQIVLFKPTYELESAFKACADYVNISGFTIKPGGRPGSSRAAGIEIINNKNCKIFNNIISGYFCGIYIETHANNNIITNNMITDYGGVSLSYPPYEGTGIYVHLSDSTAIIGNIIPREAHYAAILLEKSSSNTITNNNVGYIRLSASDGNTISNNNIDSTRLWG